jgi:hypothetical protein
MHRKLFVALVRLATCLLLGAAIKVSPTASTAATIGPHVYDGPVLARADAPNRRNVESPLEVPFVVTRYTYDAPRRASVDVPSSEPGHPAFDLFRDLRDASASPIASARGTSTTPASRSVATEAVPPRFITTGAGTTIDRASVGTAISAQRQGRHLAGAAQYNGGGYFNSLDDAQSVLDAFHSGSAQVLGTTRSGNIVVRVPGVTGFNNNPTAGFVDQATDVFFIKGSSSVSVVPANPNWVAG